MRFHELPYRLRLYILGHLLVLAPLAATWSQRPSALDGGLMLVLLLCTLIFSTWKIELTVFHAKMTLTFASICLALLLQGVHGALLCAFVGACVGTVVRPADGSWKVRLLRPRAYRVLFNLANCLLACLVGIVPYLLVMRQAPADGKAMLLGLTAFTAAYFVVNTVGVSLAIAFEQDLSWRKIWRESFLWTAPGYFASASAAAGITAAHAYLGLWSLFFVPPLYVVYYSYKLYMDRVRLHSESLTRERDHIRQLNKINHAIIVSLATAIDAKDSCTSSHIDRVQLYATALARAAGLSGPEFEAVKTGALVHDIGKLGVPDHILGKPGKLTPEEFRRIQSHVTIGAEILAPIPFPFPVVEVVRSHHERWDGLGYPDGLEGERIPIGGRIISIVDVFDALTSDRPYRRAMSHEEALRTLREGAGKQFDPRLVDLFAAVLPQVAEEIRGITRAHAEANPRAPSEAEPSGDGPLEGEGPVPGGYVKASVRTAGEMPSMSDLSHRLAEAGSEDSICGVIVERALALLPVDTAIFYLQESDGPECVAVAARGKYAETLHGMTIRVGEGVAGVVVTSRQPRVNVSAAPDIARRFPPEESSELSTATVVPVGHGSGVLGALAVYTVAYSVVKEHHLHLLNALAEHASGALQNCRLRDRERCAVPRVP
jgi:putative nucleotidyltransferase with HDIG domain